MSDMLRGPDSAVKEGPIPRVENKIAELNALSLDILDLSTGVESFLLGATPKGSTEVSDKKEPSGWLSALCEKLDDINVTLSHAVDVLRSVKSISK